MPLINKSTLLQEIAPPLNGSLASQLIDEFVSLEKRFVLRDWEPAELDGGQFCEILSRILYHIDSGNLNVRRSFEDCLDYIMNQQVAHHINPRHDALHLEKVLRVIYKFRSQRGAVHISPSYQANHMDARFMIEAVRWAMNETLRIFWNGDREAVAKAIREILQFDVPCIGKFEDVLLVQRTDLTPEEEILILLHYAGEAGMSRNEVGHHAQLPAPTVTRTLQALTSPDCRQVVFAGSQYRLTGLGAKRVRENLAEKLLIE
jgi:hypothetical protein